jgi:hypothetical protein
MTRLIAISLKRKHLDSPQKRQFITSTFYCQHFKIYQHSLPSALPILNEHGEIGSCGTTSGLLNPASVPLLEIGKNENSDC